MEMQHVRYFVALSETLNFTRAAEECNVSQPALTRAIQQLEHELGGPLIRRERRHSHLTDLGDKMLPILRQCHDSAVAAKVLATAIKTGDVSCLALGVAQTLDVSLLIDPLREVLRKFPGIQLKLRRGSAAQIALMLKAGEIDLAISGTIKEGWDRLDTYPMFTEAFDFIMGPEERSANEDFDLESIKASRLLLHRGAETSDDDKARLSRAGIDLLKAHEIDSDRDLEELVLARFGIGVAPTSALQSTALQHYPCRDLDLKRSIAVYTVAGRRRSREAAAFLALIRSADWSALEQDELQAN